MYWSSSWLCYANGWMRCFQLDLSKKNKNCFDEYTRVKHCAQNEFHCENSIILTWQAKQIYANTTELRKVIYCSVHVLIFKGNWDGTKHSKLQIVVNLLTEPRMANCMKDISLQVFKLGTTWQIHLKQSSYLLLLHPKKKKKRSGSGHPCSWPKHYLIAKPGCVTGQGWI